MVTGDLDSDGKPDIVVRSQDAIISILRNTSTIGSISFNPQIDYQATGSIITLAIDDLNGDVKPDIAASSRWSYLGNGGNTQIQAIVWQNKSMPGSISLARK